MKISRFNLPNYGFRRRPAYTLIEVLLVLALLVIVSGVTWVSLRGPLIHQRLSSAADLVRTEWCVARVDAMKSGHTFAFRYLVHGDRYHLAAQDDLTAVSTPPATPTAAPASQASATDEDELGEDPLPPAVDRTLPQGIHFLPAEQGGELAATSSGGESQAADDNGDWSDPIYFYADGSTSDAQVLVAANRHSAMRLVLRGLTGTVTVNNAAEPVTQ